MGLFRLLFWIALIAFALVAVAQGHPTGAPRR